MHASKERMLEHSGFEMKRCSSFLGGEATKRNCLLPRQRDGLGRRAGKGPVKTSPLTRLQVQSRAERRASGSSRQHQSSGARTNPHLERSIHLASPWTNPVVPTSGLGWGDVWQRAQTVWAAVTGRGGEGSAHYWHLMGGGQGCY